MKQWYEELFQNYAKKYDDESFTKGTLGEVDFIERETGDNKSFRILDIGCGTGRHSIELAKRGYTVVGIDLSESMLKRAKEKATNENVRIDFIQAELNGLFPLFHSVKDFINKNSSEGASKENTFDLMTFRDTSTYEVVNDFGNKKTLKCNERYYVPSEITWLLKSLDFKKIDLLGCPLGKWSREIQLTTEDFEMLVVAEK